MSATKKARKRGAPRLTFTAIAKSGNRVDYDTHPDARLDAAQAKGAAAVLLAAFGVALPVTITDADLKNA